MGVQTDLVIGVQSKADGAIVQARGDRQGCWVTTDGHGRYTEAARRGTIFMLDSGSVTLAAANTTTTALATVKLINGFYNPPNSTVYAALINANVSVVSGTPTGPFVYNFLTGVNLSNTVTGTIRSAFLGAAVNSQMQAEVGVVLVSATPTTTTALIQFGALGGPAAIAAGAGNYTASEDLAGRIIIPPGCVFGITQVGASTAVVQSTLVWEEFPI